MKLEVLDIINILTIVPLFFYAGFLLFGRKNRRNSSIYLAFFLLTNAIYILNFLLIRIGNYIPVDLRYFHYVGSSFSFMFGPALFFYTKSIIYKDYKLKLISSVHFIPFLLSLLYYFLGIAGFSIEYYAIKYLQIIVYFIPVFLIIKRYQRGIKNYFSSIEKIELNRLVMIYTVFLILWIIDVAAFVFYLIGFSTSEAIYDMLGYASLILNFVFANLMLYFDLSYPESLLEMKGEFKRKYEKSRLSDKAKKDIAEKIVNLLEVEKIYLVSSVSIQDFSDKLDISTRDLSQVINEILNKNFYDLVNFYRIEEAKKLLVNQNSKTVLEILYEVGFSSKSVFNAAFKKYTNTTPTQYRLSFQKK